MDVDLLRSWFSAGALELNEERLAARDQEDPIGPTGLACRGELQAFDAKVIQGLPDNLDLDIGFKMPHGAAGCG